MSSLYAMQRANGDWFALDDRSGFRVPVFHSNSHAMMARARDSGMECFRPAVFDQGAIKGLTTRDGEAVSFWLVDNPLIKLSRGRAMDQGQMTVLMREMAARPVDQNGAKV
ncbi:MAG: hypothetical protein ABI923_01630 [bacterium]